MKLFCRKEVQGAISLFLVAIMLPMMVLGALMVDTARYNLAKAMVSSAGDLAMNAALADYDTILKDVYGLFAMSQVDDVPGNVRRYFEETVVSYGVVSREDAGSYISELLGNLYEYLLVEDKQTADFLAMTMDEASVKVAKVEGSSLANPMILEKQIVEYMKYRAPVDFGMSFLDSLSAFTKAEAQTDVIQAQVDAQSSLDDVSKADYALYEAVRIYDNRYNELEPDPATGDKRHLTNYGHIFTEDYVAEYGKIHQLALWFCTDAYLGKWDLPDNNRSTGDFVILNSSGDYIGQGEGGLYTSGHLADSNTAFGQSSSDPLDRYIKPFLENQKADVLRIINGYGQDTRITDTFLDMADEANWEKAASQFGQVDAFYQDGFGEYAAALKKLDEYALAMEAYICKIDTEIAALETLREEEKQKIADNEKKLVDLNVENTKAASRLAGEDAEKVQDAEDYRKNNAELKELEKLTGTEAEEAADRIGSLHRQNQDIEDRLGTDAVNQISRDLDTREQFPGKEDDISKTLAESKGNVDSYNGQIQDKKQQRAQIKGKYQEVLAECRNAVNSFNRDAVNYKKIKEEIKQVVTDKAVAVSADFNLLYAYVKVLKGYLETAEEKLEEAEEEIKTYRENVGKWSDANNQYIKDSSDDQADGFAEVQAAGIREADNIFSEEEVRELLDKIQEEHKKVEKFLQEADANFTYMGKQKIRDITNAEQVADAIRAKDGDSGFDLTCDMQAQGPGTLAELARLTEPVPCCAFMNYLHQTYREYYKNKSEGNSRELTEEEKSAQSVYDGIKKSNDITKAVESEGGAAKKHCGYQYQKMKEVCGEGYPSSGQGGWNPGTDGTDSGKKADKSGLAANKKSAGNLLSGLASAMETGRDKLYVMAYLFDNFSYNTIVQDRVREDGGQPNWLNCSAKVYEDYVGEKGRPAALTGSNIPINALNNKIYGAEIEYVLFGSRNPSQNVTYTYAGIYALRVLFNSVYAFTSSDIRNQTRVVALAVQAASLGFIPYQLVQVVLQLALALGESAIDLKNMEAGAKVAVIKSKDTWVLSMEGVKELAKGVVKTVAGEAVDKVTKAAMNKINEIVDAGAEELSGLVQNAEKDLADMAQDAAENLLDTVFARIDALVDEKMNAAADALFYSDDSVTHMGPDDVGREIMVRYRRVLDGLEDDIREMTAELADQNSGNVMLSEACKAGGELANQALEGMYRKMQEEIVKLNQATDIRSLVYRQVYSAKAEIGAKVKESMNGLISKVSGTIQTEIQNVANNIKETAEDAAEDAKDKITGKINKFVDDKLSFKSTGLDVGSAESLAQAGGGTRSSAKAAAITFGYSDYLRLFVFIGLCASDKSGSMILRIGDLIQLNISSAEGNSALAHRAGQNFSLGNAMTYVSIEADVRLDMMFMNLGVFQRQAEAYFEEQGIDGGERAGDSMKVHYLGISGY